MQIQATPKQPLGNDRSSPSLGAHSRLVNVVAALMKYVARQTNRSSKTLPLDE